MDISQEYYNKYRYSIRGPLGFALISQPIGWDDDGKTFKRSTDVHGVFTQLSNNLEFYVGEGDDGGGYNYLKETYRVYGINAVVVLVKEINISGDWQEEYRGFFDFSTYSRSAYKISIKFNESGLYEKIKSRNSEELELDRLDTMDGTTIRAMPTQTMSMDGRKILIISELNIPKSDPGYNVPLSSDDGDVNIMPDGPYIYLKWGGGRSHNGAVIPMVMVAEQSGNVQTVSDYKAGVSDSSFGFRDASSSACMFYDEAPNDITLKMDINVSFVRIGSVQADRVLIQLVKYGGPLGLTYASDEILLNVANPAKDHEYNYKVTGKKVPLLQGQSLSLILHVDRGGTKTKETFHIPVCSITITDETYAPATQAKFVMPFEALDRIIYIITNRQNRLKSNLLGRKDIGYPKDGDASLTGLTNGFWVRQFNTEKITTKFDDFIKSFGCVWQMGYGIEKIGFDEFVRAEHISYFYQEVVTIRLGNNVSNIVRKCAKEYFYSGISIGYQEPSGAILYEEVLGLDEYNIKNSYTTPITRIENRLVNESPYRADSYGTEFARRKPKVKFPEEDTRYDQNIMIQDLKRGPGGVFLQRKWADDFVVPADFSKEGTGVYSPETATNLRFSPINTLKRMGYWIKGGFMKNLDEYVRYSSSNGNSKLKTKPNTPGGYETAENGSIQCSQLHKNLFNPELITFSSKVDINIMRQVQGTTLVNGNTIMNYYGLVEFINEDDQYEYGFLMSLEPNGDGEWEVLSSTKRISNAAAINDCEGLIVPPINLDATDITPIS